MPYQEAVLQKRNHEYRAGEQISLDLEKIQPNGRILTSHDEVQVDKVMGGGFFGSVILPEDRDYVIKTSRPSAPKRLMRGLNWNLAPFPAQVDLSSAQLEHIAANVINTLLPYVSEGKYVSPASYGYTHLPSGYAQVLEKMEGRPPRFDLNPDEPQEYKTAQRELYAIGTVFGLEQVGQIHPDNPFGTENIWKDEKNYRWIWLDTAPAIPHRGIVWPGIRYSFHYKMREEFGGRTFNRIHKDRFLNELSNWEGKIPPDVAANLKGYVNLWDHIWKMSQDPLYRHPVSRDLAGTVDAAKGTAAAVAKVARDLPVSIFRTAFNQGEVPMEIAEEYGILNKHSRKIGPVLKGLERAWEHGIISETDYKDGLEVILEENLSQNSKKKKTLLGLQGYYIGVSAASKFILDPAVFTASIALGAGPWEAGLATGVFDFTFSPAMRSLGTIVTGRITNTDLSLAAWVSLVPTFGTGLAVPVEMRRTVGEEGSTIWHYSVRNFIAKLSSLFPAGGWGTETEAKLWKLFGQRLENLGKKKPNLES